MRTIKDLWESYKSKVLDTVPVDAQDCLETHFYGGCAGMYAMVDNILGTSSLSAEKSLAAFEALGAELGEWTDEFERKLRSQ